LTATFNQLMSSLEATKTVSSTGQMVNTAA
jgi:hypothetical protein